MCNRSFCYGLVSHTIKGHLEDLEDDTNKLWKLRLKWSKPLDIADLKYVLKNVPQNKARDLDGYLNELFLLSRWRPAGLAKIVKDE